MSKTLDKEAYLKIRNQLLRQNKRLQLEITHLKSLQTKGSLSNSGMGDLTRLTTVISTREDIIDLFDESYDIPYQDELTEIKDVKLD